MSTKDTGALPIAWQDFENGDAKEIVDHASINVWLAKHFGEDDRRQNSVAIEQCVTSRFDVARALAGE